MSLKAFKQWMQNKGLSEASIEKYTRCINEVDKFNLNNDKSLYLQTTEEFNVLSEEFLNSKEVIKKNLIGHNMWSAAINNYKTFLDINHR